MVTLMIIGSLFLLPLKKIQRNSILEEMAVSMATAAVAKATRRTTHRNPMVVRVHS